MWCLPYLLDAISFVVGRISLFCGADFPFLRSVFLFLRSVFLFLQAVFSFLPFFPFPFVPVFMPAVCCFAACMAFLPDVGVDFCLCVFVDIQHFVKYFTVLGKKVSKIFGIGGKNALSLHPLSEGGAPAGKDGGEGRAGKEGEGREAERERERGISLSFSSSEKSLKKYAERFGGNG